MPPATMTLSEDGTLTLDQEFIDHIGAKAGDTIHVEKLPGKSLRIEPQLPKRSIMDFAGYFKSDIHLSLEEIEEATIQSYLKDAKKGLA